MCYGHVPLNLWNPNPSCLSFHLDGKQLIMFAMLQAIGACGDTTHLGDGGSAVAVAFQDTVQIHILMHEGGDSWCAGDNKQGTATVTAGPQLLKVH